MRYSSLSSEDLVRLCAETGENEAWQEFVRRFHKVIACSINRIARRYGETGAAVLDDLSQDTYSKVCANDFRLLREFQAQHADAFYAVLKVTAANVAHDYFRARRSEKRGSGAAEQELAEIETVIPNQKSHSPAQIERETLLREIDETLATMDSPSCERDREIFWLYYRQGLTAEEIGGISVFDLTTKGVESILHRLRKTVRAALAENKSDRSTHDSTNQRRNTDERKGFGAQSAFIKGEGQS